MAVFRAESFRRFHEYLRAHVESFFPEQCGALGPGETEKLISLAVKDAQTFGLQSQRDICKYLDVVFAFGRDFGTNPRLPWAVKIRKDQSLTPETRLELLIAQSAMYDAGGGGGE